MNKFIVFMLIGGIFGCSSSMEIYGEDLNSAGTTGNNIAGQTSGGINSGGNSGTSLGGNTFGGGGSTSSGGSTACIPKTCDEVAKEKFNATFTSPETAPAWNDQNNEPMPSFSKNGINPVSCGQTYDGCGHYVDCGECKYGTVCGADFIVSEGSVKSKAGISGICGGYLSSSYIYSGRCNTTFPQTVLGSDKFNNTKCQLYTRIPEYGYSVFCCSSDFDMNNP